MPNCFAVAQAANWLPIHLDVGDDVDFRHAVDKTAAGLLDRRPVEIPKRRLNPIAEQDPGGRPMFTIPP
jgi:hypothetical protein